MNAVVAFLDEARGALIEGALAEPDPAVRAEMLRAHHRAIDAAARAGAIGEAEAIRLRRLAVAEYAEACAICDIVRDPEGAAGTLAAEARRRGRAERGDSGALMDFLPVPTLRRLARLAREAARGAVG